MTTQFEEKGKIYTNIVPKISVPVIVQTQIHCIHGDLHVRPDERLKDELNRSEDFLAMTNAIVYDKDGTLIYQSEFLTLNRNQIMWLIPNEELVHPKREGNPQ